MRISRLRRGGDVNLVWLLGITIVSVLICVGTVTSSYKAYTLPTLLSDTAVSTQTSASETVGGNSNGKANREKKASLTPTELEEHKGALVYMGNEQTNTGWYVDTLCLKNKKSLLVYGVGAGEDISWDLGMAEEYGANVHIFDPTEKSIKYTTPIVNKHKKLFHTPEGLSDKKGTITFAMPANPDHVSMRQADLADSDMTKTVTFPVNTLRNWMKERGHKYLDVFKIDIEGSEYAVLEAMLADNFMPFTQLLVEYHDRFLPDKTRHSNLLLALRNAGFVELWSQHNGQEVGYIKASDIAYCSLGTSVRSTGT